MNSAQQNQTSYDLLVNMELKYKLDPSNKIQGKFITIKLTDKQALDYIMKPAKQEDKGPKVKKRGLLVPDFRSFWK